MLTMVIIFMSFLFILNTHPLVLGFSLMMFSFVYGLLIALNSATSWMAYMLIMVFLSGMMIILLYMTSLSSNENIFFETKQMIKMTPVFLMLMMIIMMNPDFCFINQSQSKMKNFFSSNSFELIYKTYNTMLTEMTILTITYLLIVLIVAVKIISLNKGPLKMNK